MQNDSSKYIRLKKSWDCFWGHQCLLSDGFFKHPDPECLIEQKLTTEHKKSQITLDSSRARQAYVKGGYKARIFPPEGASCCGAKGVFSSCDILHPFPDFLILGINIKTN